MAWKRDPTDIAADEAMALTVLVQCGIPADIQELLIRGSLRQSIAPHALGKAVDEVLKFYAIAYQRNRHQ